MVAPATEADKLRAVELFRVAGADEAARRTGRGKSSIRKWAAEMGVHTEQPEITRAATEAARAKAENLRSQLRVRIIEKAAVILDKLDGEGVTPSGSREYAVAFGILLDKYRLESGEATERQRTDVNIGQIPDEQIERDIARIARVVPISASKSR